MEPVYMIEVDPQEQYEADIFSEEMKYVLIDLWKSLKRNVRLPFATTKGVRFGGPHIASTLCFRRSGQKNVNLIPSDNHTLSCIKPGSHFKLIPKSVSEGKEKFHVICQKPPGLKKTRKSSGRLQPASVTAGMGKQ